MNNSKNDFFMYYRKLETSVKNKTVTKHYRLYSVPECAVRRGTKLFLATLYNSTWRGQNCNARHIQGVIYEAGILCYACLIHLNKQHFI